jgi:hypothetical protein
MIDMLPSTFSPPDSTSVDSMLVLIDSYCYNNYNMPFDSSGNVSDFCYNKTFNSKYTSDSLFHGLSDFFNSSHFTSLSSTAQDLIYGGWNGLTSIDTTMSNEDQVKAIESLCDSLILEWENAGFDEDDEDGMLAGGFLSIMKESSELWIDYADTSGSSLHYVGKNPNSQLIVIGTIVTAVCAVVAVDAAAYLVAWAVEVVDEICQNGYLSEDNSSKRVNAALKAAGGASLGRVLGFIV